MSMTENEAILIMDSVTRDEYLYMHDAEDRPYLIARAENIALNALKEIQQYRAIGTVEELKALKEYCIEPSSLRVYLTQLEKYHAIGTIEELQQNRAVLSNIVKRLSNRLEFLSVYERTLINQGNTEEADKVSAQIAEICAMKAVLNEHSEECAKTPTPSHPIPIDTQQYIEQLESRAKATVELTDREREVLNTSLSAKIMKMQSYYGDNAPETLQVLYSLRDKLCHKEDKK